MGLNSDVIATVNHWPAAIQYLQTPLESGPEAPAQSPEVTVRWCSRATGRGVDPWIASAGIAGLAKTTTCQYKT